MIHMLMNLLPGVRELRAPLIAGYIWLATAWLLLGGVDIHLQASKVGRTINIASKDLGKPIDLAIITLTAYVIGVISNALIESIIQWGLTKLDEDSELDDFADAHFNGENMCARESREDGQELITTLALIDAADEESEIEPIQVHLVSSRGVRALDKFDLNIRDLRNPLTRERCEALPGFTVIKKIYAEEAVRLLGLSFDESGTANVTTDSDLSNFKTRKISPDEANYVIGCYITEVLSNEAASRIIDDLPLVLTRLIGKESDLYSAIDRTRSEAEFRAAVSFPLGALIFAASCLLDWRLVLLFPAPVALFRLGINKRREAKDTTIQAIRAGRAHSVVIADMASEANEG